MLVLARKLNQALVIHDMITIRVVKIQGDQVKLGIDAPREISVHRQEVQERIDSETHEGDAA